MIVTPPETTYNTSANSTAPPHKLQGQVSKTMLLPAVIGGSIAFVVIILVIIVAAVCVRRYRGRQTGQKRETLLGSPSTEEPNYEIIQYKDDVESMSFAGKGSNTLSQLKLGDNERLQLFVSNTNISTITNASSDKEYVNTNPPVIIPLSKGGKTNVKERNVKGVNNFGHNNSKLEDYKGINGAGLKGKPERLTNTSFESYTEYANYSGECSDDTTLDVGAVESQEELYANSEASEDVYEPTAARQSGMSVQDGGQNDMWMRSDSMEFVASHSQSHDSCVNLIECSDDIYANNTSLQNCTANTNTQHEFSDDQELADELYKNCSEININKENGSKTGGNNSIDNQETSLDNVSISESLHSYHNQTKDQEAAQSSNDANKAKTRRDYQNARINQLSDSGVATDIPSNASFVMTVQEEADTCQYSVVEHARVFQTGGEEVGTDQGIYSHLGQDVSCVVNLYDSFR